MRNKKVRALILGMAVMSGISVTLGVVAKYEKDKFDARTEEAQEYEQTLNANTRQVYIAVGNIQKGEKLLTQDMVDAMNADPSVEEAHDEAGAGAILSSQKKANVELATVYSSSDSSMFLTQEDLDKGTYAVVDIAASQPVTSNMTRVLDIATENDASIREYEITAANLMVDQKENEAVDVRIVYPNGEDYVVLSKKYIRNLNLGNATWFTDMNEDEILRFQSAVIDAYTTTGARIYTTRYMDDNLQDAAEVTYTVRATTEDLIRSDPNVYQTAAYELNASARLALEVRLGNLTEEQLSAVASGFNLADTASSSVLTENVSTYQDEIDALGLDDDADPAAATTEMESTDSVETESVATEDNTTAVVAE